MGPSMRLSSTVARLYPGTVSLSAARSMSTQTDAKKLAVRPSATLIVVAPTPHEKDHNYRVLMMKRNAKSSFIHAHVFPGGVVDKHDDAANWRTILPGAGSSSSDLTNKICAIRETFEESGLLLTHPPAHTVLKDAETWRQRVHDDASQFKVLCETHQLKPAVDQLLPFANWITPTNEKRRYNTHFYLTVLDEAHVDSSGKHAALYAADGKETVQLNWYTPTEALNDWKDRKIVLFPPQWYCLTAMKEAGYGYAALPKAGYGALRTHDGAVATVMPQHHANNVEPFASQSYHSFLAYPGDEFYKDLETGEPTGKAGDRHRIYIRGPMEEFELEKNVNVPDVGKSTKARL